MALSDRDLAVLTFERDWSASSGAKEDAIRQRFGFSPTRYYQVLTRLLTSPDALAHDPQLISRLARLRDQRIAARATRIAPNTQQDLRD
jgi:hypothetical protein